MAPLFPPLHFIDLAALFGASEASDPGPRAEARQGAEREYLMLTELRGAEDRVVSFRPTLFETFGPGHWPDDRCRMLDDIPLFALGRFTPDGPGLIDVTLARNLGPRYHETTFVTVDAWVACGFRPDSTDSVTQFCRELDRALMYTVFLPSQDISLYPLGEIVALRADYGPAPWGGDDCLVVSLRDQPEWFAQRFELGRVVVETSKMMHAERLVRRLGRHAAGDWGDPVLLDPVDNELALQTGGELRSYYDLPSIGEEGVCIVTNAERSETRLVVW